MKARMYSLLGRLIFLPLCQDSTASLVWNLLPPSETNYTRVIKFEFADGLEPLTVSVTGEGVWGDAASLRKCRFRFGF